MSDYQPGVCNIGRAEIARRKQAGWIGTIATVVLWLVLILLHVSAVWRLMLFVTAFIAAIGFLQAHMHFCAGFGFRGVFNLGPKAGRVKKVQEEFRRRDRMRALQITFTQFSLRAFW
jgi:hypothetical protein